MAHRLNNKLAANRVQIDIAQRPGDPGSNLLNKNGFTKRARCAAAVR